jgi:hypothetical protein
MEVLRVLEQSVRATRPVPESTDGSGDACRFPIALVRDELQPIGATVVHEECPTPASEFAAEGDPIPAVQKAHMSSSSLNRKQYGSSTSDA